MLTVPLAVRRSQLLLSDLPDTLRVPLILHFYKCGQSADYLKHSTSAACA
jgi:hypothetical protein